MDIVASIISDSVIPSVQLLLNTQLMSGNLPTSNIAKQIRSQDFASDGAPIFSIRRQPPLLQS